MLLYSVATRTDFVTREVFAGSCPFVSKKNKVTIGGDRVYIGHRCHFGADVIIGNEVLIASNVSFVGGDHRIDVVGVPMIDAGREVLKTIVIEDDVWIGHGAIVRHGVRLGTGSIVAAGAVVLDDVRPFEIAGGVPARSLGFRFTEAQQQEHRRLLDARRRTSARRAQ